MDTMSNYLTIFKAHERLFLVLALLLFGTFCAVKGYDYLVKHDQVQAQIANQQAAIAAQSFADNQKNNLANLQALQQLQTQIAATNQRIDQSMQQRATQTKQQKQINDQSDPATLAVRIHKDLGVGTITVQGSNELVYSIDAAHADANALEDLAQAKADLVDTNTKLNGCQVIGAKQADTITALNTTVASGVTALETEKTAHQKDVTDLQREKKKSWLNGFKWGAIAGFVGGLFVPKPVA